MYEMEVKIYIAPLAEAARTSGGYWGFFISQTRFMILNRLGNKQNMAEEIQRFFPRHTFYIELFFGAGGMFFNKPKVKYNYVNDLDSDVYNLFRQLIDNREELVKMIELTPIVERQFVEWGKGKREATDVLNAVRFLYLSNMGLYGKTNTLRLSACNPKQIIISRIEETFKLIGDVYFTCTDFRKVLPKIDYRPQIEKVFIYADPPYVNTIDNYSHRFKEEDSYDLFEELEKSGCKWAMSEFNSPFVMAEAEKRGCYIHQLGERTNLKNKRQNILITNYLNSQIELF